MVEHNTLLLIALHDPLLCACFAFIILPPVLLLVYVNWSHKRLMKLQASGMLAKATVVSCQEVVRARAGSFLWVKYEFITMNGDNRKDKARIRCSAEALKEYKVGNTFPALYLPDKTTSYPQSALPLAIKAFKTLRKAAYFLIVINIVVLYNFSGLSNHSNFRHH